MEMFKKLFSKGISDVIDSVGNVIDRVSLRKEEKDRIKMEMESNLLKLQAKVEDNFLDELKDRNDLIKAELAQGDNFTKRARPSIIYAGIIFIFLVYILIPLLAWIAGTAPDKMPHIAMPEEFWWAWGTVVGVYGLGRSVEKYGVANKTTNLITGSGSGKVTQKNCEG
jgi:hypothetical protein